MPSSSSALELPFAALRRDEQAQQVVAARAGAAFLDVAAQVGHHLLGGTPGGGTLLAPHHRLDDDRERIGPQLGLREVGRRQAEHVADHAHRQLLREARHQLELALLRQRAEQLVGQRGDAIAQGRDHRRLEGAGDQPAQPRVLRRIVEQHPVLGRALERRIGDERAVLPVDRRAPRLAAEARAAQPGAGVGVVADEPDADDVALGPASLADRAQQRMRIVAECRMAHVDRGGRGGGGVGHRQVRSAAGESAIKPRRADFAYWRIPCSGAAQAVRGRGRYSAFP